MRAMPCRRNEVPDESTAEDYLQIAGKGASASKADQAAIKTKQPQDEPETASRPHTL